MKIKKLWSRRKQSLIIQDKSDVDIREEVELSHRKANIVIAVVGNICITCTYEKKTFSL